MQEPTSTGATGSGQSEVDYSSLAPGARIGRYEIVEILGQGGFGITYRARDEQLGREVAIKEYLPTALAVRPDGVTVLPRSTKVAQDFAWGRERFVSEGRTLASLHDAPAIVRVFDYMELNGTAYIVMELLRGDTLEARLRARGRLSPPEIDAILWPLLDGLEQVHKAGFLHRDIKPANILMRSDGKPTLIDFGASRAAMAGRTVAMTAIFTPGYAAAEQFTSAKQGPWTDIYALSATLYHAITGAAPPSAFDRMLDDTYAPLARIAPPGFGSGLLVGLDAGLAVRATDRPQSIAGWRPILDRAGSSADVATVALAARQPQSVRPSATPLAPPPPPVQAAVQVTAPAPARSRGGLYAGAAAAMILLLVGAGYFTFAGKPAPAPQAASPPAVALENMKVEELEKVLEARRLAEAKAAEKRRAEEEAQRKAAEDSEANRQAGEDLRRAEAQRQRAETELARLREEIDAQRRAAAEQRGIAEAHAKRAAAEEARRKAEAEMLALRQAEDDARRKAAIETEAKRLADEALAKAQAERAAAEVDARQKAEAEARQKAEADSRTRAEAEARQRIEAEARAKAQAEAKAKAETDGKAAEAAEAALRLGAPERQRLQVALTALGFDTRGSDGAFGPRSREMIGNWQKSRNQPATGYLTATQQQALLRDATPAIARFEEEQKKAEETRKKAEEEAKAKAAMPPPPAAAPPAPPQAAVAPPPPRPPPAGPTAYDGRWSGHTSTASGSSQPLAVTLRNGTGSNTWRNRRCDGEVKYTVTIGTDGRFSVVFEGFDSNCRASTSRFNGVVKDNTIRFNFAGGANTFVISK
jgi:peptidoglycan hydrolase-like protein with peptidoglycan-binding domain